MRLMERLACGYDSQTVFLAFGYCLTSSLLSIINKFAVLHFPYPAALTGFQYFVSAAAVVLFSGMGWVERVNLADFAMVRQMFPVLLTFYGSVYSNMKVLQHANVETFIVFRSITPLIVSVADAIFRPHVAQLPGAKTAASLLLIFVGAVGYTLMDSTFSVQSYGWGAAYVFIFCIEMIYVKDVVSHIKLSSWGLVYYNNGIGTLMSIAVFLLADESGGVRRAAGAARAASSAASTGVPAAAGGAAVALRRLQEATGEHAGMSEPSLALTGIIVSSIFGLGISFFGFSVRRKISATGFTVMGCTNKLLTLLVNTLAWEHHASLAGQACLLVCIAGGVAYGEFAKGDAEARRRKTAGPPAESDADTGGKPDKARNSGFAPSGAAMDGKAAERSTAV